MAGKGKRSMPDNMSGQSSKKRKVCNLGCNKGGIEGGDWGVFVTCDIGKESKCMSEAVDLFTQVRKPLPSSLDADDEDKSDDEDEDDIEAMIKKEVEGLKPSQAKSRPFQAIRMDLPCLSFIRFDKSIDPEELVHQLCLDAHAHPEKKRSRYIQRMTPVKSVRKTLSVELESFAREMLKPHFHSGGPLKKYAIRPVVRSNKKFSRDSVIKTVADVVGPEHPVDLKNYDTLINVIVIQNVIGIGVAGSDYEQLKKYNLAELYTPTSAEQAAQPSDV
ncbi:THUMP domain-containing protein [Aspergillus saccharolyticus JOP 1030-1]|uniref:THUMP domain protein n=1 Tax=Aspergillus saccharolyticus JOP 1030-1 TaxID=1450539 RepID=A0A318Z2A5_9EURO|nr:THUMP domain protein [Aspergillus saccharolyticus JOP 1030-1]PYH40417.1 THUMP domain protein [Aspergillus saccharolyticus JOP 1030-1]